MDDARTPNSPANEESLRAQLVERDAIIAQHQATIAEHQATITQHRSTIVALTQQRDEFHLTKLRLEVRLAKLLKQVYGPRADRVSDAAQLALEFARGQEALPIQPEDLPPLRGNTDDTGDKGSHPRRLRTHGRRDIGTLDHLPVIEKTYELTGDLCLCPACRKMREKIGTEVSYTIEHIPASLLRIKHIQCKYACRACEQEGFNPNIQRADKLHASPIDKGMAGPGLLAYIATSKFADFMPLHRLEAIFERQGFELDRSTMCLWMADAARIARPLYDRMVQLVLTSHVLATDDTVMPLLAPGKTRQARMWIYQGDESQPYNVFDFTASRARDGPQQFLKGFRGTLLADAYGGYDGIVLTRDLPRAGCWSHARRKFIEAEPAAREVVPNLLALVKRLFAIESRAEKATAEERLARRQSESRPILDSLHALLHEQKEKLLPKHPLALAIGYTLNQWKELTLFLGDAAVPIHNNLAEQQMKRIALLRKNALFAATENGGQTAAVISSLTSTCRRHGINPQLYLTQLLVNLPDTPLSRLDQWLPDRWKKTSPLGQATTIPAE
jgi:transposase